MGGGDKGGDTGGGHHGSGAEGGGREGGTSVITSGVLMWTTRTPSAAVTSARE